MEQGDGENGGGGVVGRMITQRCKAGLHKMCNRHDTDTDVCRCACHDVGYTYGYTHGYCNACRKWKTIMYSYIHRAKVCMTCYLNAKTERPT